MDNFAVSRDQGTENRSKQRILFIAATPSAKFSAPTAVLRVPVDLLMNTEREHKAVLDLGLQVDFIKAQCTTGSDLHTQTDSEEWHAS